MKKTLLWSALFAVLCNPLQADTTPPSPTAVNPAPTPSAKPTNNTQSQPVTQTIQPIPVQQVAPNPVINCDYAIPASTKVIDQTVILTWSEKATVQSFDFDPANIDAQFVTLKNCFTDPGWAGFNSALQQSGNLDAIKSQKLRVSSQIDGKAQITEAKDNQWKVTVPLQVVYQNEQEKVTQLLTINLTIGRKIKGDLGIMQMIASPRTAVGSAPANTTTPASSGTITTDSTSAPTTSTNNGTPKSPTPTTTPSNEVNTPTTDSSNHPIDQSKPTTTNPAP